MGRKAVSRLFYNFSIVLTVLIGLMAVCGSYAGYISPEHSRFFSFAGLALPVVLTMNICLIIYWGLRMRIWVVIPLICTLCNTEYIRNVYRIQPFTPVKDTPHSLVVSTYNVAVFNNEPTGYSCKEIAQHFREYQVDVACFQEFGINKDFTADSLKAVMSDWKYCVIPEAKDGDYILQVAVFSKYPILKSSLITFDESNNCSMTCDILVDGDTIRFFNNHLQTTELRSNKNKIKKAQEQGNEEEVENAATRAANDLYNNAVKRAHQAERIARLIEESPYPTIVCGDLNSIPSEYPYKIIKGENLTDGFRLAGSGYMYTYRFVKHILRIDYILVPNDFKGYMYTSPDWEYSDHNPVIMSMGY